MLMKYLVVITCIFAMLSCNTQKRNDIEDIKTVLKMSKKTFKMTTGNLYKQKKIIFTDTGIKLAEGNDQ